MPVVVEGVEDEFNLASVEAMEGSAGKDDDAGTMGAEDWAAAGVTAAAD